MPIKSVCPSKEGTFHKAYLKKKKDLLRRGDRTACLRYEHLNTPKGV